MVRVLVGKTLELKLVAPARRRLNTHYTPTRTSCVDLCGRHCTSVQSECTVFLEVTSEVGKTLCTGT